MPAGYDIDERRRIVVIYPGENTVAPDIAAVFDKVLADPRFGPGFQFISDRRGIQLAPQRDYVDKAVAVINEYRTLFGDRRWAILVDERNSAMYGMARVAEVFSEMCGVTLRVFTDMDLALEWLTTGVMREDEWE